MPIRPENKKRYPSNWKTEIRPSILKRDNYECQGLLNQYEDRCGAKDGGYAIRDIECADARCFEYDPPEVIESFKRTFPNHKRVKIVLTIAHLDHTPENCDPANLVSMCQLCHNTYDAPMRAANRRKNKNGTPNDN